MDKYARNQVSEISVRCRVNRTCKFAPAATALPIIDLLKEFFVDGTGECIEAMRSILPRVASIFALARDLGCKVIHTREPYQADLTDVHTYRRSLGHVGSPGLWVAFASLASCA